MRCLYSCQPHTLKEIKSIIKSQCYSMDNCDKPLVPCVTLPCPAAYPRITYDAHAGRSGGKDRGRGARHGDRMRNTATSRQSSAPALRSEHPDRGHRGVLPVSRVREPSSVAAGIPQALDHVIQFQYAPRSQAHVHHPRVRPVQPVGMIAVN